MIIFINLHLFSAIRQVSHNERDAALGSNSGTQLPSVYQSMLYFTSCLSALCLSVYRHNVSKQVSSVILLPTCKKKA